MSEPVRLLIVEDEALIAMMAEDMIEGLGHRVVRVCRTLKDALSACEEGGFDAALLDVNLSGDSSMPVATSLKERGYPFAFTTGYGLSGVDDAHRNMPVLTKPYALADLEKILATFGGQLAGKSSMTSTVDSNRG